MIDYLQTAGLTQAEFASRLGVTAGTVSQWLTGELTISAKRARDIERVTGGAIRRADLRPDLFGPIA